MITTDKGKIKIAVNGVEEFYADAYDIVSTLVNLIGPNKVHKCVIKATEEEEPKCLRIGVR